MEQNGIYWLNKYSRTFLERDYLSPGVTPEQRLRDISDNAEKILRIKGFSDKFYGYLEKGFYSLSTPVWINYGTDRGNDISCYGSWLGDSTDSILSTVSEVGMMTKHGGGTSGYFGELRPRGADISCGGKSNGSVSFMEIFDTMMNIISQASARRGNFAAYLPIDHGDIQEFLRIRSEGHSIQNLSIGVCISDEWMESMIDGDAAKRKIWTSVLRKRSETGYPYLFFSDTVAKGRPKVYRDKGLEVKASNLCCVVGSDRVVTSKGYLTVESLYKSGEELTLFDDTAAVQSSKMQKISDSEDVFKITLENGLTHTVTKCHKLPVYRDENKIENVECGSLAVGDILKIQSKKGLFGQKHDPLEAFEMGLLYSADPRVPDWIWESDAETQQEYINGIDSQDETELSLDVKILLYNLGEYSEPFSKIESIEYAGKEPVYCVQVDSDDHWWIVNGIVTHNSEIALPANEEESFVCCLSSMNLANYDEWKNTDAVETLTYFLDSVLTEFIEKSSKIPFMDKAVRFATRHRAIGIGVLGWHSYLQSLMVPFEGFEAKKINNEIFRLIDERSLAASKELATLFGEPELLKGFGERMTARCAIAPTTSSSFILGQISPSVEPLHSNYFIKDLAKGKFVYKNPHLKEVLKKHKKNDADTWKSILIKGGSVQHLDFLSEREKDVFKTFGEISQLEIIQQAAQRQQYIDQSQSLNLMIHPDVPPKEINKLIIEAWRLGVKTLYYQRSSNLAQEQNRNLMDCKSCQA